MIIRGVRNSSGHHMWIGLRMQLSVFEALIYPKLLQFFKYILLNLIEWKDMPSLVLG